MNVEEYNAGAPIDLGKLDGTWRLQYTSAPDVLILLESAARFSFFQVLQWKYKIMFFLYILNLLFSFVYLFFLFVLIIQDDGNWLILHILSLLTMKGFCWKLPCMNLCVVLCMCVCVFVCSGSGFFFDEFVSVHKIRLDVWSDCYHLF